MFSLDTFSSAGSGCLSKKRPGFVYFLAYVGLIGQAPSSMLCDWRFLSSRTFIVNAPVVLLYVETKVCSIIGVYKPDKE